MTTRILIADDHEVVRAGLIAMLGDTDFEVVGIATNGREAFQLAKKLRPDLVILDVRMPKGDGLSCLARLKLDLPETNVVLFSGFDNPTYIARAVALGASGYLMKDAGREEIIDALKTVAGGGMVWSRKKLQRVTRVLATPQSIADSEVELTPREKEILKHLGYGLTNKEIGKSLGISYETVKEHVQNILRKIGVADRTQAAIWAVRRNLV